MANRAKDWFALAEYDLKHARDARTAGSHEWSCFAAQQAAEKAVTALHLFRGQEAWGHVIARLIQELPGDYPVWLVDAAKVLDNYYAPTRYPNGHPEGDTVRTLRPVAKRGGAGTCRSDHCVRPC